MKNSLPKLKTRGKKIVGRGYGSGKGGHTSGRGQKGQKTRRSIGILFEGVKMKKSFIKRLPLIRGRAKLKPGSKPFPVPLSRLNVFKPGSAVDVKSLIESKVVSVKDIRSGVKILNSKNFKLKLVVNLPTSRSAQKAIEKVGGQVIKNS